MRRKHVRLKTKQTLQFGELEITVSCIINPTDPIRIITRLIEISIVQNRAHAGAPSFQKTPNHVLGAE